MSAEFKIILNDQHGVDIDVFYKQIPQGGEKEIFIEKGFPLLRPSAND